MGPAREAHRGHADATKILIVSDTIREGKGLNDMHNSGRCSCSSLRLCHRKKHSTIKRESQRSQQNTTEAVSEAETCVTPNFASFVDVVQEVTEIPAHRVA